MIFKEYVFLADPIQLASNVNTKLLFTNMMVNKPRQNLLALYVIDPDHGGTGLIPAAE